MHPCPDCGCHVQRSAASCPHCGTRIGAPHRSTAVAALLGLAMACTDKPFDSPQSDYGTAYTGEPDTDVDADTDADSDSDTDSGGSGTLTTGSAGSARG